MSKQPKNRAWSTIACGAVIGLLMLSGCRQPAANGLLGSNGNRPSLFGFGRSGSGALANAGSSLFGQNPFQSASNGLGSGGLLNGLNGFGGGSGQFAQNGGGGLGQLGQGNAGAIGVQTNSPEQYQQFSAMAEQLRIANQRLSAYDSDNQQLNTDLAAQKQKLQLANQYSQTLKDQLSDTAQQIQVAQNERQSAMQQLASTRLQMQQLNQNQQRMAQQPVGGAARGQLAGFSSGGNSSQLAGGATLRANNSLLNSLSRIQIPGGQARMDGDVIRIEFPSDQMFVPGTYQIQPAQQPMLRNLVGTIEQTFPDQIVGVEAHWDGTPLSPPGTSDHQLTATQALAMFDQLVQTGLPRRQLFTMAMASNRPRHSGSGFGGSRANRRIEVVIYPERWDSR